MNSPPTDRPHRREALLRLMAGLTLGLLALGLVACDDEGLVAVQTEDDLFTSYVALGNSITAGFQSDGINLQTQDESYAVLLAGQMGTRFDTPALNMPGCPPPLVNPLTGQRVGDGEPNTCAIRSAPVPPVVNNVAVPGAATLDILSNLNEDSRPNPLTTLILGGRTQLEAAADADPTFASVWIGNNDVLGAAISGVVTNETVTPVPTFEERLNQVLDGLEAVGTEGGVLVGVVDVTLIPHLSLGVVYWLVDQEGGFPETFEVHESCAPAELGGLGEETLVPFGYGIFQLLGQALAGIPVTLNCAEAQQVLSGQEIQTLMETVAGYNQALEAQAQARGWAYLDPNPAFVQLRQEGLIPPFPNLAEPTQLFGPIFSLDGVHPSALTHRLVTNELVEAINTQYGTGLQPVAVPQLN